MVVNALPSSTTPVPGCCRIIARAADHDGARRKAGALLRLLRR